MIRLHFIILFVFTSLSAFSQERFVISGTISDEDGLPLLAIVAFVGTPIGTTTNELGYYQISAPVASEYIVNISCMSHQSINFKIVPKANDRLVFNKAMKFESTLLDSVTVIGRHDLIGNAQKIDMINIQSIPTSGNGIESILKTLPGVSSNNELSSQYNVRGGSFDENLIYVNDVEIYRPFLIRSGLQEGMSFINTDMVESLRFSAGGFDAVYGDKMSSVLDITYRKPKQFGGSVSTSILGGNINLEGVSKNKKLTWIAGARYKTNQYLLNSLDTKGEYKPVFADIQSMITYTFNEKWDLSFLGTFSNNSYRFVPTVKETIFGSFLNTFKLNIYYEGQELDKFNTSMGAVTLQYKPVKAMSLKIIASAFTSSEQETYDLNGQYRINEMGAAFDHSVTKDSIALIGVGSFLMHARNRLNANIFSLAHKAVYDLDNHKIRWGASWQKEIIRDHVDEWTMIDSAGYSIPFDPSANKINIYDTASSDNLVLNDRVQGYLQDSYKFFAGASKMFITYGVRSQYTSFTNELSVAPRTSISIKPEWRKDWLFYFSTGYYPQMPFYREMRNPDGELNKKLRSQKSWHFVFGGDYNFMALERPFRFSTEIYYKYLWDLVPSKIDNVRLVYAADNLASGYAAGIDFKVNGEYIKGTESWVSLSFMQTKETMITGAGSVGPYPRPTDQIMRFSMFFQDYLPRNPTYKIHMMFVFGTGLPVSNPIKGIYTPHGNTSYQRLPSYKRLDIGLSKVLKIADKKYSKTNPLRYLNEIWLTGEILNVFDIENTVSYMWLRMVGYQSLQPGWQSVPNYLTPRLYNLKLTVKF